MQHLLTRLKSQRKGNYSGLDIQEFAQMLKEGNVRDIPLDLAPVLSRYRPETPDELSLWIKVCLEDQGLCCKFTRTPNLSQMDLPGTTSQIQYISDAFFENVQNSIILGNRGSGKTLMFSVLLFLEAMFKPNIELAHLGAIQSQAKRCFNYFEKIANNRLFADFLSKPVRSTWAEFKNGSKVEILVGSITGVNCIHGDSLIETASSTSLYSSLHTNSIPIKNLVDKIVIVSTLNEVTLERSFTEARGVYSGRASCIQITFKHEYLKSIICTPDHHLLAFNNMKYKPASSLKPGDLIVGEYINHPLEVLTIGDYEQGQPQDVFDLCILTKSNQNHNFLANGLTIHNSPHPQKAQIDEVDLIDWNVMQQAFSMAKEAKGYPGANRLTSTRKFSAGTMQRLIEESQSRGYAVYQWNIWDVIETCPLKVDSDGAPSDPTSPYSYKKEDGSSHTCLIYESCMGCSLLDSCKGQAKYSNAEAGITTMTDAIKQYKSLDRDTWESEAVCTRPGQKDLIYPMFNTNLHVVDYQEWLRQKYGDTYAYKHDVAVPVYAGQDAGYGCPAAVFAQVQNDPDSGEPYVVVFDEVYEHDIAPATLIAEHLKPRQDEYNIDTWFCDPSGAALMADMELAGLYTIGANNKVDHGLEVVKSLMATGRFLVDKSCTNTVWELSHYRKTAAGRPVKVSDHLCVSGDTLVNTSDGNIPIKDLVGTQGLVWCFDIEKQNYVLQPYDNVQCTKRNADLICINFENGDSLKCTPDHPVLTQRGWVQAKDLTDTDEVEVRV